MKKESKLRPWMIGVAFLAIVSGATYAAIPATRLDGGVQMTSNAVSTIAAGKKGVWVDNNNALRFDNGTGSQLLSRGVVDVSAYGAKGDCSTNDTTAVQAAITAAGAGGRVYFPPAPGNCYVVTSTLTTPNFVTLEGPGFFLGTGIPASVQIKFTTASSTLISAGTNINIRNLFLEGPGTGTAVSTASHIELWSVQFDNWGTGLSLTNTFYGRLYNCEFHADTVGISATGVYDLDLYGVIFRVVPTAVSVTDRIAALNVFGGSMEGWTTNAIVPGANSLINLNGVYFESSTVGNAGTVIRNNGTQNTFNLLGNQVYLTEASKWFDGNAKDKTTLFARGNKFISSVGSTVVPTAYTLGINATGGSVDIADEDWTGVLTAGATFVSGGATAGYYSVVDTTGALTLAPGAASTLTTKAGALTITSPAAATWSTSSGALTLTSAAAATWDDGGGTVNSANFDVTSAGGTLGLGATRAGPINLGSSGNTNLITSRSNNFTWIGNAISGGVPSPYNMSIGAYTNITASTEQIDFDFNIGTAKTWQTGNFATQRDIRIRQPVYQAAAASTITDATTFDIVNAPNCTSNMTCTNKWALRVEAGATYLGGNIQSAGTTFASLGTPANGTLIYCSDCTIANPCAGSGTGALAKRLNGVWVCN